MAMYKIHFSDNYGQCTITCDTVEEYNETMKNLQSDPLCDDIWVEYFDPVEGWQA